MKFKLLIFATFLIILVGCKPRNYQDISDSISSQPLPVPKGEYTSVAWLDEDHIAFIYRPEELVANDLNIDFRIGIFEMSTGRIKDLPSLPLPAHCFPKPSGITELTRLPNGSLGFIFRCHSDGISGTLYIWDNNANSFVEWQSLPNFLPRNFSFAPDMSQFIQENGVGDGLNNALHLVNSEKAITRLLQDFQRAGEPAGNPPLK